MAPTKAAAGGTHYYLALGDSLAQGDRRTATSDGYAEQLLAPLQQQDPSLRLLKLACGGESTETMIYGSDDPSCALPHKTQLAEAVAFLQAHRKFVSLVTIDIGADDFVAGGGVPAVKANLPVILDQLRDAAGHGIPIVGMNYYDPFVADVWFATHDVGQVQAEANSVAAFNTYVLQPIYTAAGDPPLIHGTRRSSTRTATAPRTRRLTSSMPAGGRGNASPRHSVPTSTRTQPATPHSRRRSSTPCPGRGDRDGGGTKAGIALLVLLLAATGAGVQSASADPALQWASGFGQIHLGLPLRKLAFSATTSSDGTASGRAPVEDRSSRSRSQHPDRLSERARAMSR